MMFDLGLILLIVAAIAIGWGLGRYERFAKYRKMGVGGQQEQVVPIEYFRGLNFLLNEQPDQAMDLFAKAIDVNSDTVEIYLALGSNFRKRGEVDRALKIHQDLLARSNLDKRQRFGIQLELGRDYLAAGMLDRAERFLLDLKEQNVEQSLPAIRHLLSIYEQEQDWRKAVGVGVELLEREDTSIALPLAHYCCEMATNHLAKGNTVAARDDLKSALKYDSNCVRASLLLGQIEFQTGHYADALKALKRIKNQDPDYITESVELLSECYKKLGREKELIEYLEACLEELPLASLVLSLAEKVDELEGRSAAEAIIEKFVKQQSSVRALSQLIEYRNVPREQALTDPSNSEPELYAIVRTLTSKLLEDRSLYHCTTCGFRGRTLHWMCPSCKSWGSYKPHHGN